MPIFEYRCRYCQEITERFYSVWQDPNRITCAHCGGYAHKIMSRVSVRDEHPGWIDDNLRASIQDDDEVPIQSRSDLDRVVKEKGLVENPKR